MSSGENTSSVKEMMQKVAGKFEDNWDVEKHSNFQDKWDINKNSKFQDKWDVKKNSGTSSQKKNSVLKEIFQGVAATIAEKLDLQDQKKLPEKTAVDAAESGKEDDGKSLDNSNNAEKQETGPVKSSSDEGGSKSSSHGTSGSLTRDNPDVPAPVPTSQSGE